MASKKNPYVPRLARIAKGSPRKIHALRDGKTARIPAWLERHGARFADGSFLIQTALCLPAVAAFIAGGGLRDVMGLSDSDLAAAMKALDAAFPPPAPSGSASAKATPRVRKRRFYANYIQLHVGPEAPTEAEKAQVHFQKKAGSERAMSLFPTMVGIGTPTDTDYVDVEIRLPSSAGRSRDDRAIARGTIETMVGGSIANARSWRPRTAHLEARRRQSAPKSLTPEQS